jgi:hypothetical protein
MKEEIYIFIIVLSVICGLFGFTLCCCDMNNSKLNKDRPRQMVTITFPSPV